MFGVTGFWTAIGAGITGLVIADVLFNWRGANALFRTGASFGGTESRLLAGRG
jgi:hypothetical protein